MPRGKWTAFALLVLSSVGSGCHFDPAGLHAMPPEITPERSVQDAASPRTRTDTRASGLNNGGPAGGGEVVDAAGDATGTSPDGATRALDGSTTSPPAPRAARALLLIGPENGTTGDSDVRSHLESFGLTTRAMTIGNNASVQAALQAAGNTDVVVLTSSLDDNSPLPNQLRDLSVPIVCAKRLYFNALALGGPNANGYEDNARQIQIVDSAHPLAAGQTGLVTVTARPGQIAWGMPVDGVQRIATLPNQPRRVAIFGVEKGTATLNGPAASRRVGFFSLEFGALNDTGWALFKAAITWAMTPN